MLAFQEGVTAALDAGDGLGAVLHTPAWVREHLDEARLLLLYHATISVRRAGHNSCATELPRRSGASRSEWAGLPASFSVATAQVNCAALNSFAEVPVAAVQQHLRGREPPPPLVDEMIHTTYHAVIADYRSQNG